MKKLAIFFLILCFSGASWANTDSIRVEICLDTNTIDCFGFDKYSREVTHFNQQGLLTEQNSYRFSLCASMPPDTALVNVADVYYSYDSVQHLILRDNFNYEFGTYESKDSSFYDTTGNLVSASIHDGTPGSLIHTHQEFYSYDSLNRKTEVMQLNWNSQTSSWDSTQLFNWYYSGNTKIEISRNWNSQTLTVDSTYYISQTSDTLGRLIVSDERYITSPHELYHTISYDSLSNIIFEVFDYSSPGYFDSTRYFYSYTAANKIQETITQKYDTSLMQWTYFDRLYNIYNGVDLILNSYHFNCPDTTCSDTIDVHTYYYNANNKLTQIVDSFFDFDSQMWKVYIPVSNSYDQFGRLINSSNNQAPDHCSRHEYNEFEYNSNNEVTFSYNFISTCDQWKTGCWYYNLTGDSMLVQLFYPFGTCQGDTVYPALTALGGTPPYTFQWSPSNKVVYPNSPATGIVADSGIAYILQVTDSNGFSHSDTLRLLVNCFITSAPAIDKDENISVYPNPFDEFTVIQLHNYASDTRFELYDVNGKKMREGKSQSGTLFLRRNDLKSGMYFLRIYSEDRFEGVVRIVAE